MNKKKRWTPLFKALMALLGFIVFLFLWWLVSYLSEINENFGVVNPWKTISRLGVLLFTSESKGTYLGIGWSLARLLIGLVTAFASALILAPIAGLFPYFKSFMQPVVTILKTLPTVAVVIILTAFFFGPSYKLSAPYIPSILGFLVMFPLIYESLVTGFNSFDSEIMDALKLEGAVRKLLTIREIYLPASFSYLALALEQSFGLGLKVIIMAEVLVGSSVIDYGLGKEISLARDIMDLPSLYAYSILAVLLIFLIDLILNLVTTSIRQEINGGAPLKFWIFPSFKKN